MPRKFSIRPKDFGLVIRLIEEANIVLASIDKDSDKYEYTYNRFKDAISVMRTIESTEPSRDNDIDFILNVVNNIWNKGVLSPLTLQNDEFETFHSYGKYRNKRYSFIYHTGNGKIFNENAFNLYARAKYDVSKNSQIEFNPITIEHNNLVYISKGGIITGEYFVDCIIKKENNEYRCFEIKDNIVIPVSIIEDNNINIYVVDHREPTIKQLSSIYEVPIYFNENIANKKYNLRKYIKLNK